MDTKPNQLSEFVATMEAQGLPRVVIETFAAYYNDILSGETGLISDGEIGPVEPEEINTLEALSRYRDAGYEAMGQAVMIILNGGLGTSMGLTGPKSLLVVKEGQSFLQIILKQADNLGVELAFMNSFSTHDATRNAVGALQPKRNPHFFLQHKYPKVLQNNFAPATWPADPELEWNPPGHGDVFTALHTSGMLDQWITRGIRYALIANADNLGATMDPALLGYVAAMEVPIMMEVAQRTPADMKGGHLARHRNGRLWLREIAQCPDQDRHLFQDVGYYRFFNTNSIWLNLSDLKGLIDQKGFVRLPVILNPKTLDPRDKDSPPVFQIETAMGTAISLFEGGTAVCVPPERFLPVKKCNDLLALRSNCTVLAPDGRLMANPDRRIDRIHIELDPDFFGHLDAFEKRFSEGPPSLIDCSALRVDGDVYFGADVVIKGNIRIHNPGPDAVRIPTGTVVKNDLTF